MSIKNNFEKIEFHIFLHDFSQTKDIYNIFELIKSNFHCQGCFKMEDMI